MKNLMTIIATMVFAILISSNLFGQDLPIFKMDGSIQPNGLIEYNNDSCTVDYGNPTLNAALIHNVGDDFFTFSQYSQVNIKLDTNIINKTEFTIKANLNNCYYYLFYIKLYDYNNNYSIIHKYGNYNNIYKYTFFNTYFTNNIVNDYHDFIIKFKVINKDTLYFEISKENDTTVLNSIRCFTKWDMDFTKITKITLESNHSNLNNVKIKNFELYNKWLSNNTGTKIESIKNNQKLNTVKVYPNPTSNYFKIDNDVNYDVVNLYNTNGQLINSFEKNDRYNIENLPNGVYFIMLKDNSGVVGQQKILKN